MARATQKRALETRSTLIAAAENLAAHHGYEGLRTEQIVAEAGVAKGTFFKHFGDKDALVAELIAAQLAAELERLRDLKLPPGSPEGIVEALSPLHDIMTRERYVFDVVIRYSGAAAIEQIGPMALVFGKYSYLVAQWVKAAHLRPDLSENLTADGVQAFAVQAMALEFCALHANMGRDARLTEYLRAWLRPGR